MSKDKFKILVVGASGVGKTTLLKQLGYKLEIHKDSKKTVGLEFYNYEIIGDDKRYLIQFWDFAADDRFEFLYKDFFKGANAAIIIFDWSNIETFYSAQRYLRLIRKHINSNIPFLIVGNKIDLVDDLEWFDRTAIREIFDEEGGFYIECSMNNTEKFEKAIVELIQRIGELELIEVLGKDINLKILLALNIFPELSLNKLTNLTNKSKATISRYTRSLIKSGVIKSYSKEKEKQPGSIKKKYYATNFDLDTKMMDIDLSNINKRSSKKIESLRIEISRKLYTILIFEQFIKLINNLIDKLPGGKLTITSSLLSSLKETEKSEDLRNIIDLFINFSINLKFLNENQYKKFESLKREFYLKFNEILEEDDGSKKNHVYIDAFLPILQLMELKESKNDKDTDVFKKLTDQFDMLKQKRKKKKSLQANSK